MRNATPKNLLGYSFIIESREQENVFVFLE